MKDSQIEISIDRDENQSEESKGCIFFASS